MARSDVSDVIDLIYGATLGDDVAWSDLAPRLCAMFRAQRVSLGLSEPSGVLRYLLGGGNEYADAYSAYYHRVDPFRQRAERVFLRLNGASMQAMLGEQLVPDEVLLKSEFYVDFARAAGIRHVLGGSLGVRSASPIALQRDARAGAFDEDDRRLLLMLLPHLQRALQLEERLAVTHRTRLGMGALDALAIGVVVVDGAMRVLHANTAASRLMDGARCGLTMAQAGPRPGIGDISLHARHPDDHSTLGKLIASVATGGAGGALRLRNTRDEPAQHASLAVLVSPAVSHFLSDVRDACRVVQGAATLVIRQLNHTLRPPPALMSELYGLTRAEADVALRFSGGATVEDVARVRQVSLETVRTQVKTILRKTNAASLRDLERIIAISSALVPAET
ncbi:hypothetical protein [Paraburkholderia sp. C35]|uniref:helix-turn-helix transcriptional regulator n=1 Tax=Paraburkholderia sp. C35 TaxID=2126993 RepID=UPI0013A57AB7|nr:hypothetical protein [Paraburkholderia sp. C35]